MRRLLIPLLALLLAFPASLQAQDARFKVRVLLASKQGDIVDPQIAPALAKYLKKSFGSRYSQFRLLDSRVLGLDLGRSGEVPLPDESILKLTLRAIPGDFIKLTMELKDLRTTIRIKDGGMFFQAGHRYKNGILILAISASRGPLDDDGQKLETPRPDPRDSDDGKTPTPRPIEKDTKSGK
jgi:hypothetical protein